MGLGRASCGRTPQEQLAFFPREAPLRYLNAKLQERLVEERQLLKYSRVAAQEYK